MSIVSQVDMSQGGEAGSQSVDNTPVFSQGGPKEPTTRARSTQCTVDHEAPQTNLRFLSCLMLC